MEELNESYTDYQYSLKDLERVGNRLYFNAGLVLFTNMFCTYIVAAHSTPAMGKYKYYLIFTIVSASIMDFRLSFIYGPLPLFPFSGMCSAGIVARQFDSFWGEIMQHATLHVTFSWVGIALGVAAAYRYFVMIGRNDLMTSWKGITFTIFICLTYPIPINTAFYFTLADKNSTMEFVKSESEILYKLFQEAPCYAIKVNAATFVYASVTIIGLLFMYWVSIHFSIKLYFSLLAQKNSLSTATYQLYKQMLTALIVQLTFPFFFLIFPIIVIFAILVFKIPNSHVAAEIAMQSISFHSITNGIVIVYIIKPYRDACIKIFLKPLPKFIVNKLMVSKKPSLIQPSTTVASNNA